MLADPLGRNRAYGFRKLRIASETNAFEAAKMTEQFLHRLGSDAFHFVQFRPEPVRVSSVAMECDGETMCLISDGLDEMQDR